MRALRSLFRRTKRSKGSKSNRKPLRIENLEQRKMFSLNPTGIEQEMLEMMNRVRANPVAEPDELFISTTNGNPNFFESADSDVNIAIDFFNTVGTAFLSDWASETAAPPLAWNEGLTDAALAHNNEMIAQNAQSHQLPGEDPLLTRAENAGYDWSGTVSVGENVFAYTESLVHGHTAFLVDWGSGPNGMQDPPGHRDNIMDPEWLEVGVSIVSSPLSGTGDVGPLVMTQDFGKRGNYGDPKVVGVAFTDADGDNFYDAGEGLGGITITVSNASSTFTTTTMSAGGYQVAVPSGTYNVTASGGSLTGTMSLGSVVVGSDNVKADLDTTVAPAGSSIAGTIFNDADEDGIIDSGEARLSGWTAFIDADSDGVLDASETSTTTNASGAYTLSVAAAGTYNVTFVNADPLFRISNGSNLTRTATVASGATTSNINFGQYKFASASGTCLNIFGTSGADSFDWRVSGSNHVVTIGEQSFTYAMSTYDKLAFFGSGGEDSINLVATSADETATVNRGFMTITDGNYTVNATNFEDVDLDMVSGANDQASMSDGAADDDMIAHPTWGRLIGDTYNHYIANADRLNVYATAGGNDRAYLYDGPTDDRFIGRPDFSIFRGNNFEFYTYMEGFERNFGYSSNGGEDYSFFYDSAGNDNFFGRSDYAAMQDASVSYFNYASGFDRNFAYSTAGGVDNAFFTDGGTDDAFFGREDFSIMRGKDFEFFNRADGFDNVRAYSTIGNDTANFYDSAGVDVFEGFTNYSQMTMGSVFNYAQAFSQVIANSETGGVDLAFLHDSSNSDTFFADDGYGFMSGSGYFNRVNNFEEVEIESSRGGTDISTVINPLSYTLVEMGAWI